MKFTYLLVNIFTCLVPLIATFHPKIKFYKEYRYFIPSCIIVSSGLLLWDSFFTYKQIWGFNPEYLTGVYLWNLPLEEVLFFICIPYACVFTYHSFKVLFHGKTFIRNEHFISIILISVLLPVGISYYDKAYTASAFISCSVLIFFLQFILNVNWLGRFYFIYILLLLPFLIVNGVLTGTGLTEPIVWYNNSENLGIRMLTIPIEDLFFSMVMMLGNIAISELIKSVFPQSLKASKSIGPAPVNAAV